MLIWHFHPAVGGAEQQCLRLSRELAGSGHRISVVTGSIPGAPARETLHGIEIHRVASLAGWKQGVERTFARVFPGPGSPGGAYRLARMAKNILAGRIPKWAFILNAYRELYRRRAGFDILHVHEGHWIASLGSVFGSRNGKPVIIKEASSGDYLRLNFRTQFWPALTRRHGVFIAISRQIALDLGEAGIPQKRIRVIPNGAELPARRWRRPARSGTKVVFVGNLSQQPYKGIDVLLAAWRRLAETRPEAELVLLGGGDATAMKALAAELGIIPTVRFKGAVPNVVDYLMDADAFVLPSRIEGMSNALLEAMALGMPVVATRISGSEDLVDHGENGMLVPSEDPDAMAEAIAHLLDHPEAAAEMGRKARRTIEDGFTIKAVAYRYEELYHSMLAAPGAGGKREYAR